MEQVTVTLKYGKPSAPTLVHIPATIIGKLAVHKIVDLHGDPTGAYMISHVSGVSVVRHISRLSDAKKIARALDAAVPDALVAVTDSGRANTATLRLISDAVRSIIVEYGNHVTF